MYCIAISMHLDNFVEEDARSQFPSCLRSLNLRSIRAQLLAWLRLCRHHRGALLVHSACLRTPLPIVDPIASPAPPTYLPR